MALKIKKYLVQNKIERAVMKSFFQVFGGSYDSIRVTGWNTSTVPVDDLFDPSTKEWQKEIALCHEVLECLDAGDPPNGTQWYKREVENAPPVAGFAGRRLSEIYSLYQSIKNRGFLEESGKLIKLLDLSGPHIRRRNEPEWPDRLTEKYYRLNGKRRIIICMYLGIEKIPVSVVKIKKVKV